MRATLKLAQQAAKEAGNQGFKNQDKPASWGLIAITGATVASMGVWWYRKSTQDPELRSNDSREVSGGMPSQPAGGVEQGYGRKTAEAAGMMEGDRAFQGIFPTKKITDALEGVLPASKEGHPTKDPEVRGGKY